MNSTFYKVLRKERKLINSSNPLDKSIKPDFWFNSLLGIFVYTVSFFVSYFIKRQTFIVEPEYYEVYLIIIISIIIGAILSNKISLSRQHNYSKIFRKNYISLIFSLGTLSILFIIFDISFTSRFLLLGTFIIGSVLETTFYVLTNSRRKAGGIVKEWKISFSYFSTDLMILTFVNLFKFFIPYNYIFFNKRHFAVLIIFCFSWAFSGFITHRFNPIESSKNKWHAFGLQIKFYLLNMSLIAISIYVLQISERYVSIFIENTLIYTFISFAYFIYKFSEHIKNKTDVPIVSFLNSYELKNLEGSSFIKLDNGKYQINNETVFESNFRQELQHEYLKEHQRVFSFIDRKIDLKSINTKKSVIIRTSDSYNIKVLPNYSHEFILNLHEINDFKKINDYLRLVNKKLAMGGVFAGCLIPNQKRHQRFIRKYSFFIGSILYFFDFIIKRVIPKLPIVRTFYLKMTKGKDRALSLTEALGRLVYSGFEILDIMDINGIVFFACRKNRAPIEHTNHAYSTIFKMRRKGKDGKPIFVYKLRTMHPYAEFLQEFIYHNNKLEAGGKFKNDFRIPIWGKIFRKLWIDELPMIFNFLKGDLKLVGVRPLSQQYLSLYSEEHQNFRERFKPGLVPPFYADLPKTIKEIEASEKRYLEAYSAHPIKTDISYFFKALNNIMLKKNRSA